MQQKEMKPKWREGTKVEGAKTKHCVEKKKKSWTSFN